MGERYGRKVLVPLKWLCVLISAIAWLLTIFSLLDLLLGLQGNSTWSDVWVGPVFSVGVAFVYWGAKKVGEIISAIEAS
jgi:hypothetical protein